VLRLYDTKSRAVETVTPIRPGQLRMYSCGPTVYRYAHVGNMRTFLLGDLIRRAAMALGLRVTVVQNITDVGHMADDFAAERAGDAEGGEDKILAQAAAEGRGPLQVARFYEDAFHRDLTALNIAPADEYPRASESIDLMLELIATLIDRGHAYVADNGSVFFDARSFDSYGAISGNRLDALRPGHRFEGGPDPHKRFHADWALWKTAGSRTQLVWESPWGLGFPGWHIECSAMSLRLLGDRIDVHTGGIDLRFPHHEDERAQSNAAAGHEVVDHWVHGEHVLFDGRKMAKSTGNVVLVSDLVEQGLDPLALRLLYLGTRYRTQTDLTWAALRAADHQLASWRDQVAAWAEQPSGPANTDTVDAVVTAFTHDLDTPRALQALRGLFRSSSLPDGVRFETAAALDHLFGLDLARSVGRLRDELASLGVSVVDTADGQSWTSG
jgi:cysteinyl-tRNA synthetase